jgi:hypothetical protein
VSEDRKPLGRKAYGSIGHIHGSRLGPADHHVHEGQSAMCTTKAPRDKRVWVQTKVDGSCVAVANIDGEAVALIRAGYLASSSPREQHQMFARWVAENDWRFLTVLDPGERLVGEWLAQAHGTLYDLTGREPFVAFDRMVEDKRLCVPDFLNRVGAHLVTPDTRPGPIEPTEAMAVLDSYGADDPEGIVYRVEGQKRGEWRTDFLAKWVHAGKVDGKHFADDQEVWNWTES